MLFHAPAKVNLSLEIRGKRTDGFHEIESLFVPITLADALTIAPADDFSFTCDRPDVPSDDTNLVVRAARLFFAEVKMEPRIRIALVKKIPHGAGLGGGSSDAASTLLALDKMFGTKLGKSALGEMAAKLGSDVPFFIHRSAAVCRGRGEIVTPSDFAEKLPLLLIKPPFPVPTPWAYQHWAGARQLPSVTYASQEFPWGRLVNDLERPVFEKYIMLAALKQWLLAQPETAGALLSGSGSTVFAVLRDAADAVVLSEKARAEFGETLWTCAVETAS